MNKSHVFILKANFIVVTYLIRDLIERRGNYICHGENNSSFLTLLKCLLKFDFLHVADSHKEPSFLIQQ